VRQQGDHRKRGLEGEVDEEDFLLQMRELRAGESTEGDGGTNEGLRFREVRS